MLLRHFDGGLKTAWEERGTPMVFIASSCERNGVVFEGQGDHAGERMSQLKAIRDKQALYDKLVATLPTIESLAYVRTLKPKTTTRKK